MRSQRLTKPEAGLVSGVTRDTPKKINNKDAPVGAWVDFGREGYAKALLRHRNAPETAPTPIATKTTPEAQRI